MSKAVLDRTQEAYDTASWGQIENPVRATVLQKFETDGDPHDDGDDNGFGASVVATFFEVDVNDSYVH